MQPRKIYHLSAYRRRDGIKGGVEKFAWLLEQVLQEHFSIELIVDSELPQILSRRDLDQVLWIVDGGHGLDIPDSCPIFSVCHGTWVALWARWGFTPEMRGHIGAPYEQSQVKMWGTHETPGKPNVLPIAVSSGAKRELIQYHNRPDAPILLHGVNHKEYVPRKPQNPKPVIIHVASEWRKGEHIIPQLAARLPQFSFEFLGAAIGEEPQKFARGDMFIHISCSEGNAYSCLEAMSCDLPMVVTNVGLFEKDVESSVVGKVVPFYASIDDICTAIIEVWENRHRFHPREWILQNATLEKFQARWLSLISQAEAFLGPSDDF